MSHGDRDTPLRASVHLSEDLSVALSDSLAGADSKALSLNELAGWIHELLEVECLDRGALAVALVTDAEMADLNQRFRNRSQPTDVLSFPGGEGLGDSPHLGDIAISVETAKRQAQHEGHSLAVEIQYLVLHGILHCLGYDHEADDGEMNDLELELRDRWLNVEERDE